MKTISSELNQHILKAAVIISEANVDYMGACEGAFKPIQRALGMDEATTSDFIWETIETGKHDFTTQQLTRAITDAILEQWKQQEYESLDEKIATAKSELESLMKQRAKLK